MTWGQLRVHVRAVVEERLDQRQLLAPVGNAGQRGPFAGRVGIVVGGQRFGPVHGPVQGRVAGSLRGAVRRRAAFQQQQGERYVPADRGHQQRRAAVGGHVVDRGAVIQQQPGHGQVAAARGEHERGESPGAARHGHTDGTVLDGGCPTSGISCVARAGWFRRRPRFTLAAPPIHLDHGARACMHIGAALQQQARRLEAVLGHGPHQRRLSPGGLRGLDVGARVQQRRDRRGRPGARGGHQDGFAGLQGGVRVGPGVEQRRDDGGIAVGRPEPDRCRAVVVGRAGVGPGR